MFEFLFQIGIDLFLLLFNLESSHYDASWRLIWQFYDKSDTHIRSYSTQHITTHVVILSNSSIARVIL